EPPQAAKARLLRNLGHWPGGRVEQRAREVSAARPGDEQRRRAEVLGEKPPELAASHADPARELVHRRLVQGAALDEADGARDDRRRTDPGGSPWRGVRAAATARTESSLLRRRRTGEEPDVLAQRRARRTDRAAVDAGGLHRGEEPSVESGV